MKNVFRIVIVFIQVIIFSQCNVYQYVPNSLNVPLFQEKKDIAVNLSCLNNQLAFSITDHLGIAANFAFQNVNNYGWRDRVVQKEGDKVEVGKNKTLDFELAGGYFISKNKFCFEVFTGIGYGTLLFEHSITQQTPDINYSYSLKANPMKMYLQTDLGYKANSKFEIAISAKLMDYSYTNVIYNISGFSENVPKPFDLPLENSNRHLYFFQPALTFRAGTDLVKFQTQIGLSNCLNYIDLNSNNTYVRISCFFNVGQVFKVE